MLMTICVTGRQNVFGRYSLREHNGEKSKMSSTNCLTCTDLKQQQMQQLCQADFCCRLQTIICLRILAKVYGQLIPKDNLTLSLTSWPGVELTANLCKYPSYGTSICSLGVRQQRASCWISSSCWSKIPLPSWLLTCTSVKTTGQSNMVKSALNPWGKSGLPPWVPKSSPQAWTRSIQLCLHSKAVWQTDWQTPGSVAIVCISWIRCGLITVIGIYFVLYWLSLIYRCSTFQHFQPIK